MMTAKNRKPELTAAELTAAQIRVLTAERTELEKKLIPAAEAVVDKLDGELAAARPATGRHGPVVHHGRTTLAVEVGEAYGRLDMLDSRRADIDAELARLEATAAAEGKEREALVVLEATREQMARIIAECEVQTQRRADLAAEAQQVEADLSAAQDMEADALVQGKAVDTETVDRIKRRLDTTRRALARLDDALAGAQRELEALQGRCEALQAEIDTQRVLTTGQAFAAALAALVPVAAEFKRARAKLHGWYSSELPSLDQAAMAHIRATAEAEG